MAKTTEFNPNSMFLWMPRVEAAGIPFPRTVMVPVERSKLSVVVDGEPVEPGLFEGLQQRADAFGYPLFLRTDLASGKHDWEHACYVPTAEHFIRNLVGVIEHNEIAGFFGLDYAGLVFREFLDLDSTFKAFRGMPVSRERRYFAEAGSVLCHHPYWEEGAIEDDWTNKPADWRELLADLNDERSDPPELAAWASAVTSRLGGAWSVDFARLKSGEWMLIDMALAAESWHPEHEPAAVTREPFEEAP